MIRNIRDVIISVILAILSILGLIFIGLVIYFWPVIDRINNPCSHYPNALTNCKEE